MKSPPPVAPLRLGTTNFLDTNFLLLPQETLPELAGAPESSRWVTETTRQEVVETVGELPARELLEGRFQTLCFNDLYGDDPGIRPVYYWYILSMYNPANVGSEDFYEDLFISNLIRGLNITDEDQKAHEQIRRRSSSSHTYDRLGRPKAEFLRHLEDLQSRTFKKARKAAQDRHPAYLRDIRTLSLILYNTLTSEKDAVFYTTDADPIPLVLKWLDLMCMRSTLSACILPGIGSAGMRTLTRWGTLVFYLGYEDFVRKRKQVFCSLVSDRWKEAGVRLTIRRWNQTGHRFEEDIWLTFTRDVAKAVSTMHGNLWCHFTKNDTLGNWLRFHYYWPPAHPQETRIRVEVTRKPLVNRMSIAVSPEAHGDKCKYRKEDASGEIASWSDFL
jgi:hypothetical protein